MHQLHLTFAVDPVTEGKKKGKKVSKYRILQHLICIATIYIEQKQIEASQM